MAKNITLRQRALLVLLDAENDLEAAKMQFLRVSGWKATSSTPGCYWLWQRTRGGMTVQVGESLAIAMAKGETSIPDEI